MSTDYRKKLREMAAHRLRYREALEKILALHNEMKGTKKVRNIIDEPLLPLLLELIDLAYLNSDAFTVEKTFGSIDAVYYNGMFPLTEEGRALFSELEEARKKKGRKKELFALILVILMVILVYLLVK